MRRLPTSPVLPLLALVVLAAGLAAGCGGGNTGSGTVASGATTATATAPPTTAGTTAATTAPKTTATTRASATSRAVAALSSQAYTPVKRRFAAAPLGSSAGSRLVKRGTIPITVAVGGPGRVSAFGQAQLPDKRIVHVAESDARVLKRAGVARLTLRLAPIARQTLAAGHRLVMYVAVRFSKGEVIQRLTVPLNP
jgi:hypothetical protein